MNRISYNLYKIENITTTKALSMRELYGLNLAQIEQL